ncbi:AAA family ATPase [Oceanobacillus sp. 143]|nr:AAA family ATPase [Oceanobacillus sp. 143]
MLAIYYDRNQTAGKYLARSKQTKVLSVYSPVGGAGKTTIAVNLSKQLALNNAKVFYLNLELINTTSLYFSSSEDNPSLQIFIT